MEITSLQLLAIFLISCLVGLEAVLEEFHLHRPLVACTLIGLALGDMQKGMIIGGTLEMLALGWMNVGAAMSLDPALASIISTILVIVGNQPVQSGIAVAIPIAIAGQILTILVRTITVGFQHAADRAAKRGSFKSITTLHVVALFLQAIRTGIPAVMMAYFASTDKVQHMLHSIPDVITQGLTIAGGMLVVVGYAMVINMMRSKSLMPFFYLGFVTAAFTNFNMLALGIIGTIMALLYIQLHPKYYQFQNGDVSSDNSTKSKDKHLLPLDELD